MKTNTNQVTPIKILEPHNSNFDESQGSKMIISSGGEKRKIPEDDNYFPAPKK